MLFNHDFNKNWKLNFNSSYQSYRRTQTSTAQLSTIDANGNWKRGLTKADGAEQIFGDQLSLQGTLIPVALNTRYLRELITKIL